jgi:hypothetical protein
MNRSLACFMSLSVILIFLSTAIAAAGAMGGAARKEGPFVGEASHRVVAGDELTGEQKARIDALRRAKRSGDAGAVQSLHEQLGWTSMSRAQDASHLCKALVRTDLQERSVRQWQDDVLVTNPTWSSGNPAMYAEQNGRIWVVVEDLNDTYLDVYFSDTDGATWTYFFSIHSVETPTRPSLVIGQGTQKRLLIAFEYAAGTGAAAIHVYWRNLVTQEDGVSVVEAAYLVGHPQICADCPEELAWYPYITYVKGTIDLRFDYSDIRYARSGDYGASWSTPITLATNTTRDNYPDIDFGYATLYVTYTRTYTEFDRDTYVLYSTDFGTTWSSEYTLGYSTDDEYAPRVAATYDGSAVVVAYHRDYSPSSAGTDAYYTTDGGTNWFHTTLPNPVGGGVSSDHDVCASFEGGSIFAGYINDGLVYFIRAEGNDPATWSSPEHVTDSQTAVAGDRVAVGANPRRAVEECIAWSDSRVPPNRRIYFDSGYPLGDYIIVDGPSDLYDELLPLITWKQSLGYSVRYITVSEITMMYPDGDLAERIWYYLRDQMHHTKYVLLVGEIAQIPMRILYPDGNPGDAGGYASDYYYCKLNQPSWDVDGDNRWGEFYQDALDVMPDVYVGRIPLRYSADVSNIVQNTIAYEQDTGAWKKNVLFAHGFMNHPESGTIPATDDAWASVWTISDFLDPMGWSSTTLYEEGGINPSVHTPDDPLSQTTYEQYGGLQQYGVVNCMAHGGTEAMGSYQWRGDLDGNGLCGRHTEYEANVFAHIDRINTDPLASLIYLSGCNTGILLGREEAFSSSDLRSRYLFTIQHDHTSMLYYLLYEAPVVIGSSAGMDYEYAWTHPTQGGLQSLNYYFYYLLVGLGMRAGDAFHLANVVYVNVHQEVTRGIRDINYFGDPSLAVEGTGSWRWRSAGPPAGVVPSEGPIYANGTSRRPEVVIEEDDSRDEDTTIWWETVGIDDARVIGDFLYDGVGAFYAAADLNGLETSWDGCIFHTTDYGESWTLMGDLPGCESVSSLIRADSGHLIAGGLANLEGEFYGAIYRSPDGGATWELIAALPGGIVLDLHKDYGGGLWAATGWDGYILYGGVDGGTWGPAATLGSGVYVNSILHATSGRLIAAVEGPGAVEKVMWSDNGIDWYPALGVTAASAAYDIVESCGELFVGASLDGYGMVYRSNLNGEIWLETPALPDTSIKAVRSLCAGPSCTVFAGGSVNRGQTTTGVFAWDPAAEVWVGFGGIIDVAEKVHSLYTAHDRIFAGTGDDYGKIYQHILTTATDVEIIVPQGEHAFHWTHSNPARHSLKIDFALKEPGPLSLWLYDVSGRLVRTLHHPPVAAGEEHTLIWDGRDEHNQPVPRGIYLYRLQAGHSKQTGRVVWLR